MSDAGLRIVYPKAYGPKSEYFQECTNDFRGHYQAVENINPNKFGNWQFCYYGYDKRGNEWAQEFKESPSGRVFQRQQEIFNAPDGSKIKRNLVYEVGLNMEGKPRHFESITRQFPDGRIVVKRFINMVKTGGYEFSSLVKNALKHPKI